MAKTHREVRLAIISASVAAISLTTALALIGCESYEERTSERAPDSRRAAPGGGQAGTLAGGEAVYERPDWSSRSNPGGRATRPAAPEPEPERAEAPREPEPMGPRARPSRAFPGGTGSLPSEPGETLATDDRPDDPRASRRSFPGGPPREAAPMEERMAEREAEPERMRAEEPSRPARRQREEVRETTRPSEPARAEREMEREPTPEVTEAAPSDTRPTRVRGSRAFPGAAREPAPAEAEPEPAMAGVEEEEHEPMGRSRAFPGGRGDVMEVGAEEEVAGAEPEEAMAEAAPAASRETRTSRAFPGGADVREVEPGAAPEPEPAMVEVGEEPRDGTRAFPGGRGAAPAAEPEEEIAEVEAEEARPEMAYTPVEEGDVEPSYGREPTVQESTRAFPGGENVVMVEQQARGVDDRLDYFDPNRDGLIELFSGKEGQGRLVGYTNSAEPQQIVFSEDDRFADNKARSVKLTNVAQGTVVRLFDSPLGGRYEDWVEIQVKRPLVSYTVARLDEQYYDEYVNVIWYRESEIAGEVSRMDVDRYDMLELPYRPTTSQMFGNPPAAQQIIDR